MGTVTEIHDYLRLLYARVGVPHCPKCGREIKQQTIDQMVDQVMALPGGTEAAAAGACGPRAQGRARQRCWRTRRSSGYVRVRIDGELYELDDPPTLDKKKKHNIEIVVDRLIVRNSDEFRSRLADSLETAAKEAEGLVLVDLFDKGTMLFSQNYRLPGLRRIHRRTDPPHVQLQQSLWRVSRVQRSGHGDAYHAGNALSPTRSLSFHQGALQAMAWNVQDQRQHGA